ncbi:MAG: polysulfide reductase NrfD [Actinomycetota bacterium]|nr:polysulfide reductase NrfD [Actinomycetota bacterium]
MTEAANGFGEGRFIDPLLGALSGEAAEQRVPAGVERGGHGGRAGTFEVWDGLPGEPGRDDITYYEQPVLKEPVWLWVVPAYFYVGGLGGACAVLGAAVQASHSSRRLVNRCRWTTTVAVVLSTGLLVYDLGRPERFLNMLRVFRRTSPMSVGSWVLAASGGTATGAALLSRNDGLLGSVGDLAGVGAGALGMPLAGYTAVLLSSSAIPAWQEARTTLPLLFVASAVNAAASLLDLMNLEDDEARIVQRFGAAGRAAELVSGALLEREVAHLDRTARAFKEGVAGSLWRGSEGLAVISLVVGMLPGRSRLKRAVTGLAGSAAAAAAKFAVFHAGKASARDPRATFEAQRQDRS